MTLDDQQARADERGAVRFGRGAESVVLLILAQDRSYGYEIRRRLEEFGYEKADSDPGALYRLLRDLEASGCIVSEWDIAGTGPARRYYSLTDPGRQQLQRGARRMAALKQRAERFLAAYGTLTTPGNSGGTEAEIAGSRVAGCGGEQAAFPAIQPSGATGSPVPPEAEAVAELSK